VATDPVTFFHFQEGRLLFSTNLHDLEAAGMKTTSRRWLDQVRDDAFNPLGLFFSF
jgi:hypothetical protein